MKKVVLILSLILLFSCSNTSSENTSESISNNVSTNEVISESISEQIEEKILEVDLTNNYSAVELATNQTVTNEIRALFGGLLTDFKCEKVFASDGAIKIASSKYDGSLTLSFTNKISKIEIEAKNYTNYVEYNQTYYCDIPTFLVNNIDVNINHYENQMSEYDWYTVDLKDIDTNIIKFESKNGRTIMKALKIFYL